MTTTHETTLEVEGRATLSDPCYLDHDNLESAKGDHAWAGLDLGDCTGTWLIETEVTSETQGWGDRVATLSGRKVGSRAGRTHHGEHRFLGVDAGLMGLVPHGAAGYDWSEYCDDLFAAEKHLPRGAPAAVLGTVCSSTGYGDGQYEAVTRVDDDGETVEFEVTFIPEEEEF